MVSGARRGQVDRIARARRQAGATTLNITDADVDEAARVLGYHRPPPGLSDVSTVLWIAQMLDDHADPCPTCNEGAR
jgi:hypothetical protein